MFVAILLAALLTVACGATEPSATTDARRGGIDRLPGPLPSGLEFAPPPSDAASAPDFTLTLLDGAAVRASELWADRPVVISFFASWCGTCAAQQPELDRLAATYGDRVVFLGVAISDEPAALATFLAEQSVDYPVGIDADGRIFRSYAVDEPPLVATIARGGHLVRACCWPGGPSTIQLEATLEALFATR